MKNVINGEIIMITIISKLFFNNLIKPGSVFSGRIQGGSAPWTSENYGFHGVFRS